MVIAIGSDHGGFALKEAVKKHLTEKGIEVNTGSLANGMSRPNPCEDIIRRYRELGGEIITIGSDSHDDRTIAFGFDRVTEMLKQNGYKYYSLFEGRIAEYKLL